MAAGRTAGVAALSDVAGGPDEAQPIAILRLAAGGDGVGRMPDGRTVFVPRTAAGDTIVPQRLRVRKRFARARIGRLVEPGPGRVEPRCPHYVRDECGGCQLQHVDSDTQRQARASFAGDALRRLGGLDVTDPPLEPALDEWSYRTKITLHASADRRRIGLHPLDRPDDVFDLEWCHITSVELMELWRAVRPRRRLLPEQFERVVLRLDRNGGRHLIVEVPGVTPWPGAAGLGRELASAGIAATLWWRPEGGAARAVAGSDKAFPATVFEQVNPAMGDRVRAHAIARLGDPAGLHVWDLYAGLGETAEALARLGATVDAVEADRRAVAHAEARRSSSRTGIVWHAARVEDVLREMRVPSRVITNPPRVGMDERVTAALAAQRPDRIVYISCDPATLARDIRRLGDAYRLAGLHAFDLFPQTAHVESVAILERQ